MSDSSPQVAGSEALGGTGTATGGVPESQEEQVRRRRIESAGEAVLLGLVTAFFVYLGIDSLGWPLSAALIPRLAVLVGLPLVGYRLFVVMRRTVAPPTRMIMDTGFRSGDDPANEAKRFFWLIAYMALMSTGIVLFGFHTAVPLATAVFMYYFGKVGLFRSALLFVLLLSLVVLVYDVFISARWPQPLLFDPFNALFGEFVRSL
jgi:hypothetical protein